MQISAKDDQIMKLPAMTYFYFISFC